MRAPLLQVLEQRVQLRAVPAGSCSASNRTALGRIGVLAKHIAIYGSFETWEPVWQRYWKRRKDGVKQRYWKKTKRLKKVIRKDGRYEFLGTGRDLRKAIRLAHRYLPRAYITISAREFLPNPEKYGVPGKWVDKHIES